MNHVPDPSRPRDVSRTPRTGVDVLWISLALAVILGAGSHRVPAGEPAQNPEERPKAQVASAPDGSNGVRRVLDVAHAGTSEVDPIARARQVMLDCQARYRSVDDYACTFYKRERVDGKLYKTHVIQMKARTRPVSLYFKFVEPNAGREAIFVKGRNDNKIIAHEVGLGRVVAGTMHLDPKGEMAMEENRHPVTEAGIGALIDHVHDRWAMDLNPGNSQVSLHPNAKVGDRGCLMVETVHPKRAPQFLFHKVRVYIDKELNLPIRFESYDWPTRPGHEPLLMEEYTYANLRLNVGLKERDFDPNNAQYSYGRF